MPYWRNTFSTGYINKKDGKLDVTSSQSSEIVSLLSAGTFFGALTAAPVADFFGRRLGMIASTVVFTVGVILQTAATAIPLFVAGRFFAGFGVGLISAIIPLYQSETAPKWIRGAVVGCYQLAITIGLLIAAIVDNGTKDRNDTGSYRIPIAVQFAWAIILVVGMLILPETPRYFIREGKNEQAARSLSRLRRLDVDHPALVEELAEIQANHEYEVSLGKSTYIDCFKGSIGKSRAVWSIIIALSLADPSSLRQAFVDGLSAASSAAADWCQLHLLLRNILLHQLGYLQQLHCHGHHQRGQCVFDIPRSISGGEMGPSTTAALRCDWDVRVSNDHRLGGNGSPRLHGGQQGSHRVCLRVHFLLREQLVSHAPIPPNSPVTMQDTHISSLFRGPVAWVVTGELFPLKSRAKCLSMTTASNWLLNWAIAYSTPYMVNSGPGNANLQAKVFFVWGGFCLICAFFVWALIYETKGLSLEQVDELYGKCNKAWQSKGFRPTISFAEVQEVRGSVGGQGRHLSLADIEADVGRKRSVAGQGEYMEEKAYEV